MDNYNFFGNYESEDNSFSIYEIHKKQRKKEIRRLSLYKKVLNRCYNKIKLCVDKDNLYCFFKLPEYVSGSPLYNMTDCLFFMLNELAKNGFAAKYCHPLMIYITWPQKQKNLRLENNTDEENNLSKFKNELNLKYNPQNNNQSNKPILNYRSINDYKSDDFNNQEVKTIKRINDTNDYFSLSNTNNIKNISFDSKQKPSTLNTNNTTNNFDYLNKNYNTTLNSSTNTPNFNSYNNSTNNSTNNNSYNSNNNSYNNSAFKVVSTKSNTNTLNTNTLNTNKSFTDYLNKNYNTTLNSSNNTSNNTSNNISNNTSNKSGTYNSFNSLSKRKNKLFF